MSKSNIEWTEKTWNPVTGCTTYSPGCQNCYSERLSYRIQSTGNPAYEGVVKQTAHGPKWTSRINLLHARLQDPHKWKKPTTIFVNSMSDLFHKDIPFEFLLQVFQTMCDTPRHRYQVLTKRSELLLELSAALPWPENIWAGVSVESNDYLHRIKHLVETPAKIKFLSLEPLLGPLPDLDLEGIHWVIVGGESGPGARPMTLDWARDIRDKCLEAGVPFFFKQIGGINKKKAGRVLDGKTWSQMPGKASV